MTEYWYPCLHCRTMHFVFANDANEAFDMARREGHEPARIPEKVIKVNINKDKVHRAS